MTWLVVGWSIQEEESEIIYLRYIQPLYYSLISPYQHSTPRFEFFSFENNKDLVQADRYNTVGSLSKSALEDLH